MSRYFIGPDGPRDATLAIVAEKPGRDELNQLLLTGKGRPLIGASGRLVDTHLARIGTSRERTLVLNAVQNFDDLSNDPRQLIEEIKNDQVLLYQTLASYPNLKCVVAMGNAALLSLSNFHLEGIINRRGSLLRAFTGHKMVPTLHPAFYMRGEWRYRPVVEFDLKRAFDESLCDDLVLPERAFFIEPTFTDAISWLEQLAHSTELSFDIETFYPNWIACIAFSDHAHRAFCIPLMRGNRQPYWSVDEECEIWLRIQKVFLNSGTMYISQNGLFDCWHLWRHGIDVPYMWKGFDTMYAHRVIAPDLPHALHFLTSIYTREPYYKDESGNWRKDIRVPDQQFWVYNCKDASVTLEIAHAEVEDMKELGLLDYYRSFVQPQFNATLNLRKGGFRVDKERLAEVRQRLSRERASAEAALQERLGWTPNTKSYKDMEKLFHQIRIDYTSTPTGRAKSNDERMIAYMHQAAQKGNQGAVETLSLCIDITKRRTLESNFVEMALDSKGYYHASYDMFKTVSGRSSSEGADEGGPQLQNVPKAIRVVFVSDNPPLTEVTCADLKQADAMIVAWEAQDELLIKTFEQKIDVHRVLACVIDRNWTSSELPPTDLLASITVVCPRCAQQGEKSCRHSERDRAKASGHGFRYMMGPRKFAILQAKAGVFITEAQASFVRGRVISPSIARWHEKVGRELKRTNWLTNCVGRKREFYGIFDETLVREAIAWLGSSPVSHVTNEAMRRLDESLPKVGARLLTQTHDSVTISNPIARREEAVKCLEKAFDQPLLVHGRPLLIPLDVTHGPSWGEQK